MSYGRVYGIFPALCGPGPIGSLSYCLLIFIFVIKELALGISPLYVLSGCLFLICCRTKVTDPQIY